MPMLTARRPDIIGVLNSLFWNTIVIETSAGASAFVYFRTNGEMKKNKWRR